MKFSPKQLTGNVNVSPTHPLIDLSWMLGGLFAIMALLYLLLAVGTDLIVEHVPVKAEIWLGEKGLSVFPAEENAALQARLESLLTALPASSELHQYSFSTRRSENQDVNAVALPGGNIVVFAGLLEEVKSENELAMILGHELGHFAHRDHLRGLGRGLGLSLVSALLFGKDSAINNLISRTFLTFQASYSQQQEEAADAFGLQLLAARYGHVGGADDFFVRAAASAGSRFEYLFDSHPHPNARIEHLQNLITTNQYAIKETEPFVDDFSLQKGTTGD